MTETRENAAQLDTVIDSLLRDRGRSAQPGRGELTTTAKLLYDSLPRFHPSFGFEEHLARRLAASTQGRLPSGADAPVPIRHVPLTNHGAQDPAAAAAERRRRGLVAGGAIASGVSLAIPIAGAAFVMWRRSRSSGGLL